MKSSGQRSVQLAAAGALELAREVLEIEAAAITGLIARLDQGFQRAVELILNCRGRVTVSGIGKSGHIARKIASTMASTGTPAYFVHPDRSQPRRSRHGHARRRVYRAVELGRNRRAARDRAADQAPGRETDRVHRQTRFEPGAGSRRASCMPAPKRKPARSILRPPRAPLPRLRWAMRSPSP